MTYTSTALEFQDVTEFDSIEKRKERLHSLHINDPIPLYSEKSKPQENGHDNIAFNSNDYPVNTKM